MVHKTKEENRLLQTLIVESINFNGQIYVNDEHYSFVKEKLVTIKRTKQIVTNFNRSMNFL